MPHHAPLPPTRRRPRGRGPRAVAPLLLAALATLSACAASASPEEHASEPPPPAPATAAPAAAAHAPEARAPAAPAAPAPAPPASPRAATARTPRTLLVDGLLNGGFELVADATTEPPKYGAYWVGAFSREPGDPLCYVGEDRPYRGGRALRLSLATTAVHQKIVADPRWTDELVLSMAVRGAREPELMLALEDGPGRLLHLRVLPRDEGLTVLDAEGGEVAPLALRQEEDGWWRVALPLGALFVAAHGEPPMPRLLLHLACDGRGRPFVDLDEMVATVRLPAPDEPELAAYAAELVRWTLATWALPPDQGGLGLVDPRTGYVVAGTYHVATGEPGPRDPYSNLHTLHSLLVLWLREADRRGWEDERARWTPLLERFARTLLERQFDPSTGLPRLVSSADGTPTEAAVPVAAFVEFLLDAHELARDRDLAEACLAQARRVADALVALQAEHDLPPERAPPTPVWNPNQERITGDLSNWFGFLPDRLTPRGEPETDRRFYTSWAILTGRTFWYELLRSPRAIAAVHALRPAPGDLRAIGRTLERYHRDWDAARYDLENDTDDHYGYLVEDGLDIAEHVEALAPQALALVQAATDHRLEPHAAGAGDTLWVQAVRLGTACAGDSPRAFLGPLRLAERAAADGPTASVRAALYREALLELAANDLQGRQLTNAQFTESFFQLWEMVCICFRGTYQGDCREQPADWWHGDVGDTFGGPPTSAIDAQAAALRVAGPGLASVVLARLGLMRDVTDASLRRPHGYMFGLDEAVARQYELPDKYVIGLTDESAAGLGYVMAWLRLLPHLGDAPAPDAPSVELQAHADGDRLVLRGPPGALVALPASASPFPARLAPGDPRLLALDPVELDGGLAAAPSVVLDAQGRGVVPRADLPADAVLVQPLLVDAAGAVLAVGEPLPLTPAD